jgi:hypothetical protein
LLTVIISIWIALVAASLAGFAFRKPIAKSDRDAVAALGWSAAAVLPGACLLAEYLLRRSQGVPLLLHAFTTLWPVAAGVVLGFVALVVSCVGLPPARSHTRVNLVRATHLAAWVLSGGAVVVAFVSV